MPIRRLLIANRGEIAVRIARAAAELGIETVAVFSEDDELSLHITATDDVHILPGKGPRAYLSVENIVDAARLMQADAIHPGYGLLSESAELAQACLDADITFVGPRPDILLKLGDKAAARDLAQSVGVRVLEGTDRPTSLEDCRTFFESIEGPVVIKAVAGGGGRGMGVVGQASELTRTYDRCQAEAAAAFGNGALYVERYLPRARHLEVQVAGDGHEAVHFYERDCTIQRRNQKLVEIAPAPGLDPAYREELLEGALQIARAVDYTSLGTFEFLMDVDTSELFFIEANPRVQVEHTITEEITGTDLVQLQLQLASGTTLKKLGLEQENIAEPRSTALQLRINAETMQPDGSVRPSFGAIGAFEPPTGPGIRVDTHAYAGYTINPRFDSLLAKLIVRSGGDLAAVARKARRALAECCIDGLQTNLPLLRNIVDHPKFAAWDVTTTFIADHIAELTQAPADPLTIERPKASTADLATADPPPEAATATPQAEPSPFDGDQGDVDVPPPNTEPVPAPTSGTLASIEVAEGDKVLQGQQLATIEALKMLHIVSAPIAGTIRRIDAAVNDTIPEGQPVFHLERDPNADLKESVQAKVDLDHIRPDLAELQDRLNKTLDEHRPGAVDKRRKLGFLTARQNVANIVDPGSFIEYGQLTLAAQRQRRSLEDLVDSTPADGMVVGLGSVNKDRFGEARSRAAVLAYDYTVLAGTQGYFNHQKTDRVLQLAEDLRLPVIFFTEGGGGRPGDVDTEFVKVAGLTVPTFATFGKLSGLVPRIAVNSGRCFAGNAALFGSADVTIATKSSNIGMAGPAMIEGGGLGQYKPEDIGPIDVQHANGVVDLVAEDEADAARLAKQVLGYFQGPAGDWEADDQRKLRHAIPENRKHVYDIRPLIETLADTGSFLELRRPYGPGMITGFVRIEGRPFGLIANDPKILSGAIDAAGGEKAGRFIQLCDAFDLPILSLCDTPGFMVGPESEKEAAVRRVSRMFVVAASVSVPWFMVCLRKGYGLGAQAMAGGGFHASTFTISWPSGEFGGMGLEGAVRLGFRKELEAETDPEKKQQLYDVLVNAAYDRGKALNMAAKFEIDQVIDPTETRAWITRGLQACPPPKPRDGKKRPHVDTW